MQPIFVENADKDTRFSPQDDEIPGVHLNSTLCIPLAGHEGEVFGVLQVRVLENGIDWL